MRKTLQWFGFVVTLSGCPSENSERNSLASDEPDLTDTIDAPDLAPVGPVMAHSEWITVSAGDDPFSDRPDDVVCERGLGWEVEVLDDAETLTIETNACNYLGVTQPALREVGDGETFAVQLWHFQLEGGGPAHAAVAIDGAIVWEKTIEIPADSALIYEEFDVPGGAAAGAPVVFHLHNHGLNSWNLVAIRVPD